MYVHVFICMYMCLYVDDNECTARWQRARLYELRDAIDRGEDMETFELSGDMLTTAALLKLFLLELPTPLLTFDRYHDFLSVNPEPYNPEPKT